MGIQVEFNPDLALRNISEYKSERRTLEECIPESLQVGRAYAFLKKGQRVYWFDGEMPLCETTGDGNLSRPLASIVMIEAGHKIRPYQGKEQIVTHGLYLVKEVYDRNDPTIHFEGWNKVSKSI
jgi:hypothetical protein